MESNSAICVFIAPLVIPRHRGWRLLSICRQLSTSLAMQCLCSAGRIYFQRLD